MQIQHRNSFFKYRTNQHLAQYKTFRNLVKLIKREENKQYFQEKCHESIKSKDFWKAVKPIYSETKTKQDNIPLGENGKIVTDNDKIYNMFNNIFREIGSDVGCKEDLSKSINELVAGYEEHQSINTILFYN